MIAAEETTAGAQTPTTIALMANVLKGDTDTIAKRTKETGIQGKVDGAVARAAANTAAANTAGVNPAAIDMTPARVAAVSMAVADMVVVANRAAASTAAAVNMAAARDGDHEVAKAIGPAQRTIGITRTIGRAGMAALCVDTTLGVMTTRVGSTTPGAALRNGPTMGRATDRVKATVTADAMTTTMDATAPARSVAG